MIGIFKYFKHFLTISKHKYYVCKYCFKFGLYRQGILHDISKFGFKEFFTSAKRWCGTKSPISIEKDEKGYSLAWLHHKGHNPHHWEYWIDFDHNQHPYACRIPIKYVYEMIADWISAGIVYGKTTEKDFDWSEPYEYYKAHNRQESNVEKGQEPFPMWEFCTQALIDTILVDLKLYGIKTVSKMIRDNYYYKFYNNLKVNKNSEILEWLEDYNQLVIDYYNEN